MMDFGLFREKLFAYACASNAINGLARGAVLFVLIFFLQGPYGLDPLWAGIMMAPFGAAFMFVGPVSGHLSDKLGSRGLATAGLLVSGIGLLGLATVVSSRPYWLLALYQALTGGGSGSLLSAIYLHVSSREDCIKIRWPEAMTIGRHPSFDLMRCPTCIPLWMIGVAKPFLSGRSPTPHSTSFGSGLANLGSYEYDWKTNSPHLNLLLFIF